MTEDKKAEDRRFFLDADGKTKYYINAPNANDIREADWQYSKIYTRSLTEGITTSAEMLDILQRRDIVGPAFEQRTKELTTNLNEKIWSLEAAKTMDEKRDLAVEVAGCRDELFQWNQRLNGPMANTCEQLADDARLEYLSASMIADEDDKRIWESYEDYTNEKDQTLILKTRFEVMLYLQGLESDFLDQTPEAIAMKEVETDVLKQATEVAKALEAVEEEEQKVSDEKPKLVKRAPRKKAPRKKKAE